MKRIFYSAVLGVSLFGVVACGEAEPEQPPQTAPEPEVPMSAEVAEPTGVMNAEPEQEQQEPSQDQDTTQPEPEPEVIEADTTEIPEEAIKEGQEPVDEPDVATEQSAPSQ